MTIGEDSPILDPCFSAQHFVQQLVNLMESPRRNKEDTQGPLWKLIRQNVYTWVFQGLDNAIFYCWYEK